MQPVAPSFAASSSVAIALGPFVLQRPIGAGGMGEVWQGVHAEEHVPVAIKVIGPAWARHVAHRRAFQREVRAVAGLSHPAIVAVFDDGVVDAAAAAGSDGRLAEGSPYLAMEYMPRGSLEGLLPALDWPLVQVIVEGTLAGLAHAHARGVIHCDLKPANILLSGWSEVAIKLTDFGVAHALGPGGDEEGDGTGSSAGTPAYMAPEQLLGRSRDFGPWTDLYALGCTVWEMCCAQPPFVAADLPRLAGQHLYEEPGAFRPVFPVPPGVEPWLRRLLAKRPQGRFARAADALARLRALGKATPVAWSAVAVRSEALAERAPTRPGRETAGAATRQVSRIPRALAAELTASADAIAPLVRADTLPRGAGPGGTLLAHGPGGMPRAPGPLEHGPGSMAVGPIGQVEDPLGRTVLADDEVRAGVRAQVEAAPTRLAEPEEQAPARPEAPAPGRIVRTLPSRGAPPVPVPQAMAGGTGADDVAPFAASWRLPHDAAASKPLHGAGLGLVRVRELPLVGRDGERDRLWAALARVREGGRPGLVLVRGPSGVGKSRLVEWTAARAHELGAAEVLRAAHGPFGGAAEGLPRMLATHLRCVGLGGDATYDRCLDALAPDGADETGRLAAAALTEIVCPGDDGPGRPRVRLQDARERYHVLAGYLALISASRPALVWIDDAQWGSGALELVRHCLRAGEPRALFVATVRDDLLAERPAEAELLAELAGLPGAETMSVGPLPEDQHHALVEELLGLERRLVDAIVARTAGNPLFSVELVGDWVARGLLRPGPGGFVLREGAEVDLPDDLHALWRRRVEGLLARHFPGAAGEAARTALELAAAIGQEIDAAGWAHACALAGIAAPPDLALVLVRENLAAATPAGWAFSHGMLRESLERMAEEAGRAADHHRICARMVRELGERGPGMSEEVARHLIAAGDLREALAPLLAASYELQLAAQYGRAEAALTEHAGLCDRLGLASDDRERLHGRMQGAWLAWMRGGEGAAGRCSAEVDAIAALARARGHDDVLGEALRWRGLVARFARNWGDSLAALAEAADCFGRTGDAEGLARTALARAVTLRATGQLEEAEERLAEAERLARARGLAVLLPRILGNLAEIALQRADFPEAQERFARALRAAEQVGDRKALALTSGGAGDLAFVRGELQAAEEHYRRAEALFSSLGSRYLAGIRLHLAALDVVRGGTAGEGLLRAAAGAKDPLHAAEARLALATAAGSPGAFAEHVAAAGEQLARGGEARRVLVRLADLAADRAARDGWPAAAQARALARAHEARLDMADEA